MSQCRHPPVTLLHRTHYWRVAEFVGSCSPTIVTYDAGGRRHRLLRRRERCNDGIGTDADYLARVRYGVIARAESFFDGAQ
jgi:hypothetical protein